ncbi:MAG: WD40/YVTN/BNR-like repeat-containing protein [Armatimonadota bacterium]
MLPTPLRVGVPLLILTVLATGCLSREAPAQQAEVSAQVPDGQWMPIGLAGGGGMFSPGVSPVDPDLMMVNCDMSGAYISEDGGGTWRMIHHQQLQGNTRCRPGFHPTDANVIYAANGWGGGVKVTHDRGRTWSAIGDLPGTPTGLIYVSPEDPSVLLTGVEESVYMSRDSGEHWAKCDGPTGEAVGFLAGPKGDLFAATSQGVWRSDNGGQTWVGKTRGLPSPELRSFAGGANRHGAVLYCAVPSRSENGKYVGGVYRSRDLGEHWEPAMGNGINKDTRTYDEYAEGDIAQYHHVLTTNAAPLTVYAINSSTGFWPPHFTTVYRSDDAGENWRPTFYLDPRGKECNVRPNWFTVSTGRAEPQVPYGAAICDSDPSRLIRVDGFCYITHDGGKSWFCANATLAPGEKPGPGCEWVCNGLTVTTTWHHYVDPFEPNRHYICYTDIGFARSVDAGKTWIWWTQEQWAPWSNTCYELAFDPDTPGKIWGAFSNVHDIPNDNIISGRHGSRGPGGVCLSTDFGQSWPAFGKGLPVAPATSIVLDPRSPKGKRTLYVSIFDEGVFKSVDDGASWVKKSEGLGAPENMRVYRLILHKDGTLFALITAKRKDGAFLEKGVGLYRSRDGGESWECITASVGLLWPKDVAVHPESSETIFVGAADAGGKEQGGLYRTTDGGETWKRVAREGSEHFGAYFDPRDPNRVYMTLTEGAPGPSLWLSKDGGDTWQALDSFPFANTQRVEFDPIDPDTLYVTTFGGSVFRGRAPAP